MDEKRVYVATDDMDESVEDHEYENAVREKPLIEEDQEFENVIREKPSIEEDRELENIVREKPSYYSSPQRHRNGVIALDDSREGERESSFCYR